MCFQACLKIEKFAAAAVNQQNDQQIRQQIFHFSLFTFHVFFVPLQK